MVVEDDPGSRTALKYVLAHAGHEVLVAGTLAEAFHQLDVAAMVDLVILDLMLPDGDGTDVLRSIRSSSRPDTRVAVTTGVSDPQWLARVKDLRPDGLLPKPIKMDELFRLL